MEFVYFWVVTKESSHHAESPADSDSGAHRESKWARVVTADLLVARVTYAATVQQFEDDHDARPLRS